MIQNIQFTTFSDMVKWLEENPQVRPFACTPTTMRDLRDTEKVTHVWLLSLNHNGG